MQRLSIVIFSFVIFNIFSFKLWGHEVRPAYLGITQINDSTYHVVWNIPAQGSLIPKIRPVFPESFIQSLQEGILLNGALKRTWTVYSQETIIGKRIDINGLSSTLIDVLIHIKLIDGIEHTELLKPDRPFYIIPKESTSKEVAATYTFLGIEHIIFGIDHLLFILALIFVTTGKWKIIKTITAFTIAHSITLSLAVLGLLNFPTPPVEAVIALSIVFLAREIIKHRNGFDSLTYRYPWIVAFVFGLLHGFGFASALNDTGLPQSNIPVALAFFNMGVELGQIAFVLIVILIKRVVASIKIYYPYWLEKGIVYCIGGFAFYWVIDRVVGFW